MSQTKDLNESWFPNHSHHCNADVDRIGLRHVHTAKRIADVFYLLRVV